MKNDFYTRKGDEGSTGLLGSGRVMKSDPQIEVLGAIDEANASLGLARSLCSDAATGEVVLEVQRLLYQMMGELAATPENAAKFRTLSTESLTWVEQQIDILGQRVTQPGEFIIPGDNPAAAAFSLARTVVRRAERELVRLGQSREPENLPLFFAFINRLSTLCYVLELLAVQSSEKGRPTLAKKD